MVGVPCHVGPSTIRTFVADSWADLYLYVVEGIKFTSSTVDFEKEIKKSTFSVVDKIDSSAYAVSSQYHLLLDILTH